MKHFARTAALFLALAGSLPATGAEKADWHEDIKYLAEALPAHHNNLFHHMSEAEFQSALEELNSRWPTLDRHGAMLEISRLLAPSRDGHVFVEGMLPPLSAEFDLLPVEFYLFSDGLYIRAADPDHASLAGAKVLQIGGLSADEAYRRAAEFVTHDNDMTLVARTPYYLQSLVVLAHIGAAEDTGNITLTLERDGVAEIVSLTKMNGEPPKSPYGLVEDPKWQDANPAPADARPLWQSSPLALLTTDFDKETGIFYLQYNAFEEPQSKSLDEALAAVKAEMSDLEIEKFVLDIRRCRGGETPLVRTLGKWLMENPQINRQDRFFVIIGRRSFSAAQLLVNVLEQFSNAIFVGEPTGSTPIFYANARPNVHIESKNITILLPIKHWQTTEEDDYRDWQEPDLATDLTFAEYKNGRDPAMDAIANFSGLPDLRAILIADLSDPARGIDAAIADYNKFKASSLYRYWQTETLINDLGYDLLSADRPGDAVKLLSLNVRDHPNSANAHDSLAEAYLENGDRAKSITHYQKSLDLDPGNDNAREQIARLKGSK